MRTASLEGALGYALGYRGHRLERVLRERSGDAAFRNEDGGGRKGVTSSNERSSYAPRVEKYFIAV